MIAVSTLPFDAPAIAAALASSSFSDLDQLDFGVIGFDASTKVRVYNAFESHAAGLRAESVVDRPLFRVVAPCMDNALVAQRFDEAVRTRSVLDVVVPYVLTLRMRPTRVLLRLVADPAQALRYVLVQRDV